MKTAKTENIKKLLSNQTEEIAVKVTKEISTEIKRHMSALKEDFSGQLKVVAEAVAGNSESLSVLRKDMEFVKGNLVRKVNYEDFLALTSRVSKLEEKVK